MKDFELLQQIDRNKISAIRSAIMNMELEIKRIQGQMNHRRWTHEQDQDNGQRGTAGSSGA